MKKVLSLVLALAVAAALGVSAVAAEDFTAGDDSLILGDDFTGDGTITMPETAGQSAIGGDQGFSVSPFMNYVTSTTVNIVAGEIVLVYDDKIVEPEDLLAPDSTYKMDVYYATDEISAFDVTSSVAAEDKLSPLKEDDLKTASATVNAKLRLRSAKGTSVMSSATLDTTGVGVDKRYQVKFETKDLYNTKQTEVEYRFSITGTPTDAALAALGTGEVGFLVGHGKMADSDVDSYAEGDTVAISNDTPIWTKKQIDRLVKAYNYKAIELENEDGSWIYTGRMSGMGDTNFYTTQAVIPSIMNKFDQDFKFLILPAGVTFPTNGEMRIDVSDVSGEWDRMYTYLYRNGALTRINTTYDSADDMIVFRTNYLGAFVMTDVEITDTSILEQPGTTTETPSEVSPLPTTPTPQNPNTGAPVGLELIVGLGGLSLLTAGSVLFRRKK